VVDGPAIEYILNSVNFDDEESMNWFHRTLKEHGVIEALREAGAAEGSTVRIDNMEFDFVE
jgi:GTP-binding protein